MMRMAGPDIGRLNYSLDNPIANAEGFSTTDGIVATMRPPRMAESELNSSLAPGGAERFATIHWSVVLLAGQSDSAQADEALEKLCRAYWYPLYAYVRRQGYAPQDAQDLTQEFFSRLLDRNELESVDRSKGKFRSFLLTALKHLLANEWKRSQRQKRGGGSAHFSLDELAAEDRYQLDPADERTPEDAYQRRWAETVVDSVTRRLE